MVQFPFYLGKHLISQLAEVRPLGDVLAYQPVCVLVCTTLPRVVWACEIELGIESLRNLLMAGEFLSVVSRYRMYLLQSNTDVQSKEPPTQILLVLLLVENLKTPVSA